MTHCVCLSVPRWQAAFYASRLTRSDRVCQTQFIACSTHSIVWVWALVPGRGKVVVGQRLSRLQECGAGANEHACEAGRPCGLCVVWPREAVHPWRLSHPSIALTRFRNSSAAAAAASTCVSLVQTTRRRRRRPNIALLQALPPWQTLLSAPGTILGRAQANSCWDAVQKQAKLHLCTAPSGRIDPQFLVRRGGALTVAWTARGLALRMSVKKLGMPSSQPQ